MNPKKSQRFEPSKLTEKLIPVLLILITLALLIVLVLTGLAVLGFTPAR